MNKYYLKNLMFLMQRNRYRRNAMAEGLEEDIRKLSRWLGFPLFWSGLVGAWLFTGHAPSGRGSKEGTKSTPGGRYHTVSTGVSMFWFSLAALCSRVFQSLPCRLIHQKRQSILVPYKERRFNRPVIGLDRDSKWEGTSQ